MLFRHRLASGRLRRHAAWLTPVLLACALAAPVMADENAEVQKLLHASRHAEALSRVDAAIASKPRDAQLRFLKGVILSEMNKPAEAIALFTRLTEEFPQLPEPWNNLAVLYAGQGQYDKARAALEKALRTNPSYATAYENLGDIHAKLAAMAYERALQVDGGSGSANARSTRLALVKNLGQANNAPPRIVEPAPLPRPQSLPQALPPSTPQPLPQQPLPQQSLPAQPSPAQPSPAQPASKQPAQQQPLPPMAQAPQPPKAATPSTAPAPKAAPSPAASVPPVARVEPESRSRAGKPADGAREAVLAAVHAWARDWSERDVKGYLSHYAPDFETPGRQSRKAWAEDRQARIVGKGRIQVKVEAPQVSVENGRATVKFRQQYSSDRLTVSSRKTLVLVQQKGRWLIQKESTGG